MTYNELYMTQYDHKVKKDTRFIKRHEVTIKLGLGEVEERGFRN